MRGGVESGANCSSNPGLLDGHINDEELTAFAKVLRAYLAHDKEDREGIAKMATIICDPEADPDEVQGALETMRDGLYPTGFVDLEGCGYGNQEEKDVADDMDNEEASFADRLASTMKAKGVSQVELASLIGVGQPAVCMMLARDCRPQRRTVEKLAAVLGVSPQDLWPSYQTSAPGGDGSSSTSPFREVALTQVGQFDFTVPAAAPCGEVIFQGLGGFADNLTGRASSLGSGPEDPRAAA